MVSHFECVNFLFETIYSNWYKYFLKFKISLSLHYFFLYLTHKIKLYKISCRIEHWPVYIIYVNQRLLRTMASEYSLRFIVVESFCHFGTFHILVESFYFLVKVNEFLLTYFIISSSPNLFLSYFILSLLNSLNIIFFNLCAEKKCLHYYAT